MDLQHDLNNVVDSLVAKLSKAELTASQYEAVILAKEEKINELQKKLDEQNKTDEKDVE